MVKHFEIYETAELEFRSSLRPIHRALFMAAILMLIVHLFCVISANRSLHSIKLQQDFAAVLENPPTKLLITNWSSPLLLN